MFVSLREAETWRPEINENIWNSLLFLKRLFFSCELPNNHINLSPSTLNVQTAKITRKVLSCMGESFVTAAMLVSCRVKS